MAGVLERSAAFDVEGKSLVVDLIAVGAGVSFPATFESWVGGLPSVLLLLCGRLVEVVESDDFLD